MMNKLGKILFGALVLLGSVSCEKWPFSGKYVFTGHLENLTRVTVEADNHTKLVWNVDCDTVSINGCRYDVLSVSEENGEAVFTQVDIEAKPVSDKFIAYYPARFHNGTDFILPQKQVYDPANYADSFPMYAVAADKGDGDIDLNFSNLGGAVELRYAKKVGWAIKKVIVSALEPICGKALVNTDNMSMVLASEGSSNSMELIVDDSVAPCIISEEGKSIFISLPPLLFTNLRFQTVFLDELGHENVMSATVQGEIDIVRNTLYTIDFDANISPTLTMSMTQGSNPLSYAFSGSIKDSGVWDISSPRLCYMEVNSVVPSAQEIVKNGKAIELTGEYDYSTTVDNLEAGKKYIFVFTASVNEIPLYSQSQLIETPAYSCTAKIESPTKILPFSVDVMGSIDYFGPLEDEGSIKKIPFEKVEFYYASGNVGKGVIREEGKSIKGFVTSDNPTIGKDYHVAANIPNLSQRMSYSYFMEITFAGGYKVESDIAVVTTTNLQLEVGTALATSRPVDNFVVDAWIVKDKLDPEIVAYLSDPAHTPEFTFAITRRSFNITAENLILVSGRKSNPVKCNSDLKASHKFEQCDYGQRHSMAVSVKIGNDIFYSPTSFFDLGLPEGAVDMGDGTTVYWHEKNLGATNIAGNVSDRGRSSRGNFYMWGEVESRHSGDIEANEDSDFPKGQFTWSNNTYKYQACECKGDNQERVSKYILKGKRRDGDGDVDDKDHLDLEDDAARHELNWPWRMPRRAEFLEWEKAGFKHEVKELSTDGAHNRYFVVKNASGTKELRFSSTGIYLNNSNYKGWDNLTLWTSDLYDGTNHCCNAYRFGISGNNNTDFSSYETRTRGLCIRPVCPKITDITY